MCYSVNEIYDSDVFSNIINILRAIGKSSIDAIRFKKQLYHSVIHVSILKVPKTSQRYLLITKFKIEVNANYFHHTFNRVDKTKEFYIIDN